MEIIERTTYLNHVLSLLDKGVMIILTGQRRVGKSCLLEQVHRHLQQTHGDANVLYVNKEYAEFSELRTWRDLYDYACKHLPEGGRNYLLVDEVQDIDEFEHALRSLYAEQRCQVIVTGSNAKMLSSELSTLLAGRYVEVTIHSLNYREFLTFHNLQDSDESLTRYLTYGGLPGLRRIGLDDECLVTDYLTNVYHTVMLRDVVAREQIRNVPFLERLLAFMADNIGKLFSVKSVSDFMQSRQREVSVPVVSSYLRYLCNAYIIHQVARYDIHGKKLLEQNGKYYFEDIGLRNLLCGFRLRQSIERVMENAVWLHLRQHRWHVAVGTLRAGEIDFVARKGEDIIYVQVAYLLSSDDTIAREFGSLARIPDNHPKYVVSLDPVEGGLSEYPGIKHQHLRRFLMNDL